MHSPSIISLPYPVCQLHNLPYTRYCCYPACYQTKTRLCPNCLPEHSSHEKYIVSKEQVITDLQTGLKHCFQKIQQYDNKMKQLTNVLSSTKSKAKQQYEQMQTQVIKQFKKEKELLQDKLCKMQSIVNQIHVKQRLSVYFAQLKAMNLLSLRVRLSSIEGMRNFREKNQKFCISMQRSAMDAKLYEEFNMLSEEFSKTICNNSTFRIGQMIALKNSRKKIVQNKQTNPKNPQIFSKNPKITFNNVNKDKQNQKITHQNALLNRQKQRPRTDTNFGQAIIGSILKFFKR